MVIHVLFVSRCYDVAMTGRVALPECTWNKHNVNVVKTTSEYMKVHFYSSPSTGILRTHTVASFQLA